MHGDKATQLDGHEDDAVGVLVTAMKAVCTNFRRRLVQDNRGRLRERPMRMGLRLGFAAFCAAALTVLAGCSGSLESKLVGTYRARVNWAPLGVSPSKFGRAADAALGTLTLKLRKDRTCLVAGSEGRWALDGRTLVLTVGEATEARPSRQPSGGRGQGPGPDSQGRYKVSTDGDTLTQIDKESGREFGLIWTKVPSGAPSPSGEEEPVSGEALAIGPQAMVAIWSSVGPNTTVVDVSADGRSALVHGDREELIEFAVPTLKARRRWPVSGGLLDAKYLTGGKIAVLAKDGDLILLGERGGGAGKRVRATGGTQEWLPGSICSSTGGSEVLLLYLGGREAATVDLRDGRVTRRFRSADLVPAGEIIAGGCSGNTVRLVLRSHDQRVLTLVGEDGRASARCMAGPHDEFLAAGVYGNGDGFVGVTKGGQILEEHDGKTERIGRVATMDRPFSWATVVATSNAAAIWIDREFVVVGSRGDARLQWRAPVDEIQSAFPLRDGSALVGYSGGSGELAVLRTTKR